MAKGDDIQARLIELSVRIMDLVDRLPKTPSTAHINSQLLRSSSSAAAQYAEARGAESKADFIHKLGMAFKELNESEVWLDMLRERGGELTGLVTNIREDCSILCRIVAASRKTAATNLATGKTARANG